MWWKLWSGFWIVGGAGIEEGGTLWDGGAGRDVLGGIYLFMSGLFVVGDAAAISFRKKSNVYSI